LAYFLAIHPFTRLSDKPQKDDHPSLLSSGPMFQVRLQNTISHVATFTNAKDRVQNIIPHVATLTDVNVRLQNIILHVSTLTDLQK
jgi:hypothetical protein